MKKTKKILTVTAAVIVLVLVLAILLVNLYGDRALRYGIETVGTQTLKVPVHVEDLSLAILAGKLNINKLAIENPEGYQHPLFLEAGHTFMALKTSSLLSDTIEFEQITLDGLTVVLEQKGLTTNLQEILNNLPKAEEPDPTPKEVSKNVVVKQLEITNVNVKVSLLPGIGRATALSLKLAPIRMTDLGTADQMTTARLVKEIVTAIAVGIAEQGKGLIPTDVLDSIGKGLTEGLLKTGQETIKGIEEAGKGILEQGKDIGEGARGLLDGLIPKKEKQQ
jgi:hypothetical protein